MDDSGRRGRLLRRMALLCLLLVLVITSLSAFIRLSKAGLGCADWPACYGRALRQHQQGVAVAAEEQAATAAARLAHRVVASAALLLVIVMAMTALSSQPRHWRDSQEFSPGGCAGGCFLPSVNFSRRSAGWPRPRGKTI